jgi:hypothetical protein
MKKIANRGRKILSRVFRIISVSAASLILQACYGVLPPDEPGGAYGMPAPAYGMPPVPNEASINGRVFSNKNGDPIFGIKVSVEGTTYTTRSNEGGNFYFGGVPIQDVYNIKFEDVDDIYNGGLFKEKTVPIRQEDNSYYINFMTEMELIKQSNEE